MVTPWDSHTPCTLPKAKTFGLTLPTKRLSRNASLSQKTDFLLFSILGKSIKVQQSITKLGGNEKEPEQYFLF